MIFVVKKYRHYLLANKFVFFMDHQTLLYLMNKPCNKSKLLRWFLILLDINFMIKFKQKKKHLKANHLSWMIYGEKPTEIDDDLPDVYLFLVVMIPKRSKPTVFLLTIGTLHNQPPQVVENS